MPRLFISHEQIEGSRLDLEGDGAHHLGSALRVRPGEVLRVVDDRGEEHGVRVTAVRRGRVTGEVLWSRRAAGEPRLRVHVVQALIREMDQVVATLAEVGATAVHPVVTRRSVTRPDPERADARLRHWREVARAAAELAHRAAVPAVHPLTDLGRAVGELPADVRLLACSLDAPAALARIDPGAATTMALAVGPEGGLAPDELAALAEAGAQAVHLGPRVLPAAHAGALAVGLLLARAGELDAAAPPPPGTGP